MMAKRGRPPKIKAEMQASVPHSDNYPARIYFYDHVGYHIALFAVNIEANGTWACLEDALKKTLWGHKHGVRSFNYVTAPYENYIVGLARGERWSSFARRIENLGIPQPQEVTKKQDPLYMIMADADKWFKPRNQYLPLCRCSNPPHGWQKAFLDWYMKHEEHH